jgi:hypothetical protein
VGHNKQTTSAPPITILCKFLTSFQLFQEISAVLVFQSAAHDLNLAHLTGIMRIAVG